MNWKSFVRGLSPRRYAKQIVLGLVWIGVMTLVAGLTLNDSKKYVTASPTISQHFTGVMSEKMLVDFCYQIQSMRGITGVSYSEYSYAKRTALVTIYYDPQLTSPRQIRIFMEHASILWREPKAT